MAENIKQNQPELDLGEQQRIRQEKLKALQEEGKDPFVITKYDQTHHTTEAKELYIAHEEKLLAGRVAPNVDGLDEAEARENAKIIGLAALKYGDLSNQASKDYVFDVDRFTSFEGNTGPYILYTIVRIKSILNKYAENGGDLESVKTIGAAAEVLSDSEKGLMLQITRLNEMLENAYEEIAPHKVCQYCYELSDAFNKFYHETKIIAEEDKTRQAGWIELLKLTKNILLTCIDLLGFEAPERM